MHVWVLGSRKIANKITVVVNSVKLQGYKQHLVAGRQRRAVPDGPNLTISKFTAVFHLTVKHSKSDLHFFLFLFLWFIYLIFYLLGPQLQRMEVPRLGV